MCARAFEAGWAGAAFKTIRAFDIHETSARFFAIKEIVFGKYGDVSQAKKGISQCVH